MKRSRRVPLTLAASTGAAVACAGSAPPPPEALRCVERGTDRVVADSLCNAARLAAGGAADGGASGSFGAPGGTAGEFGGPGDSARGLTGTHAGAYGGGHAGGGPYFSPFLWYYGGRVAGGFARAGSYEPLAGARYRSNAGYVATGAGRGGGFFSRGSGGRGGVSRGGFGGTAAGRAGG